MTTETISRAPAVEAPRVISHWIDGAAVPVAEEGTGPVYNPASGEVIARVPRGGADEVDAAVRAARAAFPAWRDLPLIARSQIFFAYRELVWQHREELAALITRDHGKTFPDALTEVLRGMETIEYACGLPVHLAGMNTPNHMRILYLDGEPADVLAAIEEGDRARKAAGRLMDTSAIEDVMFVSPLRSVVPWEWDWFAAEKAAG